MIKLDPLNYYFEGYFDFRRVRIIMSCLINAISSRIHSIKFTKYTFFFYRYVGIHILYKLGIE